MGMKEQQRSVYRSMQGKEVDMHKIVMQNEMTVAVGNVRVNARGDELGPGGRIIRKREEVLAAAANAIPAQNAVRATVEEEAPVATTPVKTIKNIKDMDPEGNE